MKFGQLREDLQTPPADSLGYLQCVEMWGTCGFAVSCESRLFIAREAEKVGIENKQIM